MPRAGGRRPPGRGAGRNGGILSSWRGTMFLGSSCRSGIRSYMYLPPLRCDCLRTLTYTTWGVGALANKRERFGKILNKKPSPATHERR